ncbi:hypothetical protein G6F66_014716 [Rhizopus arrhizus]|nr:hypothetical protein G6F66_014716 [Rhizopus arrhizus]
MVGPLPGLGFGWAGLAVAAARARHARAGANRRVEAGTRGAHQAQRLAVVGLGLRDRLVRRVQAIDQAVERSASSLRPDPGPGPPCRRRPRPIPGAGSRDRPRMRQAARTAPA